MLKITTLSENYAPKGGLAAEHGFSVHIDLGDTQILFDTGQTGAFFDNAAVLGIDLAAVEHCVISHGHYDHSGGLPVFCEYNRKAAIWVHESAFIPKYASDERFIGMPDIILRNPVRSANRMSEIAENVYVLPAVPMKYQQDIHIEGFFKETAGGRIPDTFADEQSLVIRKNDSISIISGCSHRGICNIVEAAIDYFNLPVDLVLGGFHLRNEKSVDAVAAILNTQGIARAGISHCTGIDQYCDLKNMLDAEVFYSAVGVVTVL